MTEQLKSMVDVVSLSTVLAAIVGWLPAVAAALSIVWTVIRIWETKTVRNIAYKLGWTNNRRTKPRVVTTDSNIGEVIKDENPNVGCGDKS